MSSISPPSMIPRIIRSVSTVVLPLPAPAETTRDFPFVSMALSCDGVYSGIVVPHFYLIFAVLAAYTVVARKAADRFHVAKAAGVMAVVKLQR